MTVTATMTMTTTTAETDERSLQKKSRCTVNRKSSAAQLGSNGTISLAFVFRQQLNWAKLNWTANCANCTKLSLGSRDCVRLLESSALQLRLRLWLRLRLRLRRLWGPTRVRVRSLYDFFFCPFFVFGLLLLFVLTFLHRHCNLSSNGAQLLQFAYGIQLNLRYSWLLIRLLRLQSRTRTITTKKRKETKN